MSDTAELTTEQAVDAWQTALHTLRALLTVEGRLAIDRRQGVQDLHDRTTANRLRAELDQLVSDHGWQGTYVDPMVSDWHRAAYTSCVYSADPPRVPPMKPRTVKLVHGGEVTW